jgi:Domain of unknown function (DUF6305)
MSIGLIFGLATGLCAQTPQAIFEPPLLITSAGQSADAVIASSLAKRAALEAALVKIATEKDLAGRKTPVLVIGASMKGLGAAGIDTAKEADRVRRLLTEAKRTSTPVLAMHLGGAERRGELTDDLITEFLPAARAALVVKAGNQDGLFTKICAAHAIPLIEVEKSLDAVELLKSLFKK